MVQDVEELEIHVLRGRHERGGAEAVEIGRPLVRQERPVEVRGEIARAKPFVRRQAMEEGRQQAFARQRPRADLQRAVQGGRHHVAVHPGLEGRPRIAGKRRRQRHIVDEEVRPHARVTQALLARPLPPDEPQVRGTDPAPVHLFAREAVVPGSFARGCRGRADGDAASPGGVMIHRHRLEVLPPPLDERQPAIGPDRREVNAARRPLRRRSGQCRHGEMTEFVRVDRDQPVGVGGVEVALVHHQVDEWRVAQLAHRPVRLFQPEPLCRETALPIGEEQVRRPLEGRTLPGGQCGVAEQVRSGEAIQPQDELRVARRIGQRRRRPPGNRVALEVRRHEDIGVRTVGRPLAAPPQQHHGHRAVTVGQRRDDATGKAEGGGKAGNEAHVM